MRVGWNDVNDSFGPIGGLLSKRCTAATAEYHKLNRVTQRVNQE